MRKAEAKYFNTIYLQESETKAPAPESGSISDSTPKRQRLQIFPSDFDFETTVIAKQQTRPEQIPVTRPLCVIYKTKIRRGKNNDIRSDSPQYRPSKTSASEPQG